MTKWDLISITLDQLISQWGVAPNLRDQFDVTYVNAGSYSDTIIKWDPRHHSFSSENSQSHISRLIQITFKRTGGFSGNFTCTIADVGEQLTLPRQTKEKNVQSEQRNFATFTKLHKRFRILEENIIRYKKAKENNSFLEDLIKVFPRTLDGAILGEDYDD